MPTDDLKEHATSSQDFYGLLGVTFETAESDIRRAYRRTALKYHPDKNAGNESAIEKFHLLQIAYDVLSDPTAKAIYDNARRARKEKEEREAAFEGRRKQMKDDLERRESGAFKRKREEDDAEAALEREIKRLAEDGARRRRERQELLNREKLEEEEREDKEREAEVLGPKGGTEVDELDRSVKVHWAVKETGSSLTKDDLTKLFARFGKVEKAFLLKEKKKRIEGHAEKRLVGTGVVVYVSVVGAHAAVEDTKKQSDAEFTSFLSVQWASGAEPSFLKTKSSSSANAETKAPSTPAPRPKERFKLDDMSPSTPMGQMGGNLKKVPSFASFSATNTPKGTPQGPAAGTPSHEELTMIRLRNAGKRREEERKRLEEQIRVEESAKN